MDTVLSKQMIINRLPIPTEIQDYTKEFLFLDKISTEVRKNKKALFDSLDGLIYLDSNDGHWALTVCGDQTQLQAVNCNECGEYLLTGMSILPTGVRCTCTD